MNFTTEIGFNSKFKTLTVTLICDESGSTMRVDEFQFKAIKEVIWKTLYIDNFSPDSCSAELTQFGTNVRLLHLIVALLKGLSECYELKAPSTERPFDWLYGESCFTLALNWEDLITGLQAVEMSINQSGFRVDDQSGWDVNVDDYRSKNLGAFETMMGVPFHGTVQ